MKKSEHEESSYNRGDKVEITAGQRKGQIGTLNRQLFNLPGPVGFEWVVDFEGSRDLAYSEEEFCKSESDADPQAPVRRGSVR